MGTDPVTVLKESGLRLTRGRLLVLGELAKATNPLTADQLWSAVGRSVVDRVSIYRELANLEKHGVIVEARLGGRAKSYELASSEHAHHLICIECGAVDRMAMPNDLDHFEKSIEQKKRFRVVRHALEFFGYCAKCQI